MRKRIELLIIFTFLFIILNIDISNAEGCPYPECLINCISAIEGNIYIGVIMDKICGNVCESFCESAPNLQGCGLCVTCLYIHYDFCFGSCTAAQGPYANPCLWHPCGEDCNVYDFASDSWEYYCDGLKVMKHRRYFDFYCNSNEPMQGTCINNFSFIDETLVKTCSDKCINGACYDCQDNDNDGYKDTSCGGTDCNDNNSNIKPGITETCFNQIDDNCNGQIDENCGSCINGQTKQCGTDIGQCTFGTQTCVNKEWGVCTGGTQPVPETCPINGIDEDCDGEVDEINCNTRSDYIADWQDDLSDTPSHYPYISYVSMGHLSMTYWHEGDIDNDGITEKYLLLGEPFRTAFFCQAQEMKNKKVSNIVDSNSNSYGCNQLGNIMSEKSVNYCGGLTEWSYEDQIFSTPQKEIYNSDMYCLVNGAPSGWGWPSYKITYNGKNVAAVRCGLNRDCPFDKYCKKPNINDVTTYYCELKCGNGICEVGENCPQDASGAEICDGKDNDCDGQIDENLIRQCGTTNLGECKYGIQTCSSGNWGNCVGNIEPTTEVCDSKDNNCNGQIDENLSAPNCDLQEGVCAGSKKTCGGPSGWLSCNEYNYGFDYQTKEVSCDNKDNDCDGQIDENVKRKIHKDNDGDGYGNETDFNLACSAILGFSTYPFDCNDNDNTIHVGAPEICDNKDNNCDGRINENCLILNQGWNLLSFPLNPTNNSINSIFKNINFSSIFSYDSWLYYFNKSHNNFNKINSTMGLWINSLNNQTLTIEGTKFIYPIKFSLKQGYNLISYPSLNPNLINESLKKINFTSIKTYKNNKWYSYHKNRSNSLNTLQNLTPGYAYWIKLPNNLNITFNGTHFN